MNKVICMYCRQEVVDNLCGCVIRYIQAFNLHGVDIFPLVDNEQDNPF